jgi:hypothetical protein
MIIADGARLLIGTAIGFTVLDTYDDGGEGLSFAMLSLKHRGDVQLGINRQPGAARSTSVYSDGVDERHRQLKDRVDVGRDRTTRSTACEFIIRDPNRF